MRHVTVLKEETVRFFSDTPSGTVVDCTLGFGGHSEALLELNPHIHLVGIDRDAEALESARNRLKSYSNRTHLLHGSYGSEIQTLPPDQVTGIIADLGISSWQIDSLPRGFSFQSPTLDMRMNPDNPISAKEIVNDYPLSELERIFHEYGEFREYKKAASLIVNQRKSKRFESGVELGELFSRNFPRYKIHPATQIFQAIRMEVNDELGELKKLLDYAGNLKAGIIAIISFHSLEDRLVKQAFKSWEKNCICEPDAMRCTCGNHHAKGKSLTKKPIIPSPEEIKQNSRSRSAKLRVFKMDSTG